MIIVAVLLANSVKQARKPVINITAAAGGTSAKGWRWPPIQEASPDSCQTPQDGGEGSKIKSQHNKVKQRREPNRAEQQSQHERAEMHYITVMAAVTMQTLHLESQIRPLKQT